MISIAYPEDDNDIVHCDEAAVDAVMEAGSRVLYREDPLVRDRLFLAKIPRECVREIVLVFLRKGREAEAYLEDEDGGAGATSALFDTLCKTIAARHAASLLWVRSTAERLLDRREKGLLESKERPGTHQAYVVDGTRTGRWWDVTRAPAAAAAAAAATATAAKETVTAAP
jgi:hypothetical protein